MTFMTTSVSYGEIFMKFSAVLCSVLRESENDFYTISNRDRNIARLFLMLLAIALGFGSYHLGGYAVGEFLAQQGW